MEAQDNISKQFKEAARNMESVPTFPSMERIWDKVEERLDEVQERKKIIPLWSKGIAAAVFVLVSLSALYLLRRERSLEAPPKSFAHKGNTGNGAAGQQAGKAVAPLPADGQQSNTPQPAPVIARKTAEVKGPADLANSTANAGAPDQLARAVPVDRYTATDSIGEHTAGLNHAGKRKIKGVVTDENMEPVIGAMVTLKGTTTSVLTDVNGMYAIDIDSDGRLLEFKAAGMEPKDVALGAEANTLLVKMSEDKTLLPEVITYGGTFDRTAFAGTLTPVYGKDIADKPLLDIAKAIASQAPGTEIRSGGGQPGDNAFSFGQTYQYSTAMPYTNSRLNAVNGTPQLTFPDMQQGYSLKPDERNYLGSSNAAARRQEKSPAVSLRGLGTAGGGEPLIVVDGKPFDGKLSDLNPEHIASIKVLKDSTTTRIFGARSTNGVIQVMTRKALDKDSGLKKGWGKAKRFMGVRKGVSTATR
jgi:hypothetical protein